jgi:hypothetical protein
MEKATGMEVRVRDRDGERGGRRDGCERAKSERMRTREMEGERDGGRACVIT